MTALVSLLPGLLAGALVAYVTGLVQQQAYAGVWDPLGPLGWFSTDAAAWVAGEMLVWVAFVLGITVCWLIPSSYTMRVGLWSGLNSVSKRPAPRWFTGLTVALIALVGLTIAASI